MQDQYSAFITPQRFFNQAASDLLRNLAGSVTIGVMTIKELRIPKQLRRYIDMDYWRQLNGRERQWLVDFIRKFYLNNRDDTLTPEQQRVAYNRNNAGRRDIMNRGRRVRLKTI